MKCYLGNPNGSSMVFVCNPGFGDPLALHSLVFPRLCWNMEIPKNVQGCGAP